MEQYLQNFLHNVKTSVSEQFTAFSRSIPDILLAVVIVAVGVLIAKKIGQLSRRAIVTRTDDLITINFLTKAVKIILSAIFVMYALKIAGLDSIATGILTAAGASAVIIGFAFKDIGENFISGIILSFNRPFNVNETVSIGEVFGKVKDIQFRYTKLRTFDGKDVYIPNSDVIKKPVFNFTEDGWIRFDFIVGIAYENEIGAAEKLILDVLTETDAAYADDDHPHFVAVDELGVSTVNLKVHFWVRTMEYGMEALLKKGEVITNVKNALLENGFGLPANIVEMKLYETQDEIPVRVRRDTEKE